TTATVAAVPDDMVQTPLPGGVPPDRTSAGGPAPFRRDIAAAAHDERPQPTVGRRRARGLVQVSATGVTGRSCCWSSVAHSRDVAVGVVSAFVAGQCSPPYRDDDDH